MSLLREVIVFTPNMSSMREFYEDGVGLTAAHAGPRGARYGTAGAALALETLADGREREIEIAFETFSIEADVERLRARGVEMGEIRSESSGRRVHLRDHEGNRLSLRQGGEARSDDGGDGPAVATVIVNCRDLLAGVIFYRDRLGLKVAYEAPHWVELETGATRLALHTHPMGLNHPLHAAQRLAYCLQTPDLATWVDEMRARGLHFATAPIEEEFGLYAEALDPDGNVVVFREPRPERSIEEELAEAFESDEVPHVVAIRKPVLRGGKAVSRVALKPEYHEPKVVRLKPEPELAYDEPERAVAPARGARPVRPRQKPKTRRLKATPAIGRSKKAVQKSQTRRKSAAASASRSKPVKRAAARPVPKKRTTGRR